MDRPSRGRGAGFFGDRRGAGLTRRPTSAHPRCARHRRPATLYCSRARACGRPTRRQGRRALARSCAREDLDRHVVAGFKTPHASRHASVRRTPRRRGDARPPRASRRTTPRVREACREPLLASRARARRGRDLRGVEAPGRRERIRSSKTSVIVAERARSRRDVRRARPRRRVFPATGWVSPKPAAKTRSAGTPAAMSARTTVSARAAESSQLS